MNSNWKPDEEPRLSLLEIAMALVCLLLVRCGAGDDYARWGCK